jgi:carbon monoxide dehydrogenase subunit G
MKHIEATVDLAVDADTAWKTVGDPGGLADWLPAIDSARMDGDIRLVEFAGGMGSGREQILAHDDAGRTLRYAYLEGPIPLQDYTATMTVEPAASGSRFVWSASFNAGSPEEADALGEMVLGMFHDAQGNLKALLEA